MIMYKNKREYRDRIKIISNALYMLFNTIIVSSCLGTIITLLFYIFKVYLYVDIYVLLMIPIFLFLYFYVDTHYLCLAYAYPIYVSIVEFFKLNTYVNLTSYIFLMGVLHLTEGLCLLINSKMKIFNNCSLYRSYKIMIKNNEIKDYKEFKKLKFKYKTCINIIYIIPSLIPIVTNYHLYEIVNIKNTNLDISFSFLMTLLFFIITYKYSNEKANNDYEIYRKLNIDGLKIIIFSFICIVISRIIEYLYLADYVGYVLLIVIVLLHELLCCYSNV